MNVGDTRYQEFMQGGEYYATKISKVKGDIPDHIYYEMECLTPGLQDVRVAAHDESDLLEMMYWRLAYTRCKREI